MYTGCVSEKLIQTRTGHKSLMPLDFMNIPVVTSRYKHAMFSVVVLLLL